MTMEPSEVSTSRAPSVAVLSPYYNRMEVVEASLRSIADQTYENLEAIIWDDRSPDGTWQEIQRCAAESADTQFTIYQHESNLGLTAGLNRAIERADVDYIAIVGSGDLCDARRIERQVEALENDPDAVFCATASTTTDPISGVTFFDSSYEKATIETADIAEHCPFTHGTVMYRASALKACGGYESAFVWCADWDLWFRLLRNAHAVYLPEVLYRRTAQLDGASFNPEKAFVQIACKHLAIELSRVSDARRAEILTRVRSDGLATVIGVGHEGYRRDLARRNIKLYLMGRRTAGDEMRAIASARGVQYSRRYRMYSTVARLISYLPFRSDGIIRIARSLAR